MLTNLSQLHTAKQGLVSRSFPSSATRAQEFKYLHLWETFLIHTTTAVFLFPKKQTLLYILYSCPVSSQRFLLLHLIVLQDLGFFFFQFYKSGTLSFQFSIQVIFENYIFAMLGVMLHIVLATQKAKAGSLKLFYWNIWTTHFKKRFLELGW